MNPIPVIFDTEDPPASPEHALGGAAIYDEATRTLRSWHVTDSPDKVAIALETEVPLTEFGDETDELSAGFYASAVPQLWIGRAVSKWDFLEELEPEQKVVLAEALRGAIDALPQGYITDWERTRAYRDVELFETRDLTSALMSLAGQPYNIRFWRSDFLEALGIEPGPPPVPVEIRVAGTFAGFTNIPKRTDLEEAKDLGLDGAYLKGGFFTVAQMVVWNDDALLAFGAWRRS